MARIQHSRAAVPRGEQRAQAGEAAGPSAPDVLTFTSPVDAVYTWVDGSDAAWKERRAKALNGCADVGRHPTSDHEARYEDHDELRYSLRALQTNAPWIQHVYLVTDRQTPRWLAAEHPGLTVVDHREILPPEALPTFNSHVVESALHRIPGLAEHFLYFNDDVILGRPVTPEQFFTPGGGLRVFPSPKVIDGQLPVMQAARRNSDELQNLVQRSVSHRYRHTPHPQSVSLAYELEARLSEAVAETRAHPFRHPRDISFASSLVQSYACATGRGVPGEIGYTYVDLSTWSAVPRLLDLALRRPSATVCLNQVGSLRPGVHRLLRWVMSTRWRHPCTFELHPSARAEQKGVATS